MRKQGQDARVLEYPLKKPPFLLDREKRKGCLTWVDGALTYFINRATLKDLQWVFWHCDTTWPYYTDPSLENLCWPRLTKQENWVEYSETKIIKDEDVEWRGRDYPLGYRVSHDRLDFYVTKAEFRQAFLALKSLGRGEGAERVWETTIFAQVRVVLIYDKEFGNARDISFYGHSF